MTKQKQPSPEVRIKFNVDASSKEASDKLQPDRFKESVKKESIAITRNTPKSK